MDLNKSVSLGVIFGLALFALYLLFPQTGGVGNLSTQWSFSQATSLRAKSSDSFHSSTVDTDVLPRPTDAILSLKSQTSHDFAENQDVLMGRDSFEHQALLATERELTARRAVRHEQRATEGEHHPNLDNSASSILKKLEGRDSRVICNKLLKKYNVVPGASWGTLTSKLQKVWTELSCDTLIDNSKNPDETETESVPRRPPPPTEEQPPSSVAAGSDEEWCWSMRKKYHVKPMKSWGDLPENQIQSWKSKHCDFIFTAQRLTTKPLSTCRKSSVDSASINPETYPNMSPTLPLISIMAATTTRKIDNPSTATLSLFNYLLPSLIRTLDCGYRYEYVLGYDKGDPFYDSEEGMKQVRTWFIQNVKQPMEKNGILFTLRLVKVNNTLKKPGPVFIEMARAAYDAGASFFYRVNDDTEMLSNWPTLFVKTIESMTIPYGVIGPSCDQGNQKILTHDFVHRVHMEIFEMNYYPPELTDWWMDDWISLVYGQTRTFKAKDAPVTHHTGAHGQRYAVDHSHEHLLSDLVIKGRQTIRQYMLKHNIDEKELARFDKDRFQAGFVHRDVPVSVKESLA